MILVKISLGILFLIWPLGLLVAYLKGHHDAQHEELDRIFKSGGINVKS